MGHDDQELRLRGKLILGTVLQAEICRLHKMVQTALTYYLLTNQLVSANAWREASDDGIAAL